MPRSNRRQVGLIGLYFLDPIYPFMKRLTHWPQAVLGEWQLGA